LKNDKILSTLSIAAKAGKIKSGELSVENAIKQGSAFLVVIAKDVSDRTRNKFINSCKYYEVPYIIYATKDELGHYVGKEFRATLSVDDAGLAKSILDKYKMINEIEKNGGQSNK